MKLRFFRIICFLMIGIILTACTNKASQNDGHAIQVAAAISLTDALNEVKLIFEDTYDVQVHLRFAGSGTLARQIEQGSGADVFISSNIDWMDELESKGFLETDTRKNIIGNKLVLVTQEEANWDMSDLGNFGDSQLAIGNPDTVPAGKYAKETLENLNVWEKLESQLIYGKDVRQVVTYVESGNVEAGFIYYSDAAFTEGLYVASVVESDLHEDILYPGAVIADTENLQESIHFLEFLLTDEAQEIFQTYGFKGVK